MKGSSFFSRLFSPSRIAGDSVVCRLDAGERRAIFFEAFGAALGRRGDPTRAFFARTLRAGRGFRAVGFFAELFFFFGFAMVCQRPLIDSRRKNGRLIKNISLTAQADSPKKEDYALHKGYAVNLP